jgi:DNA-binding response OmpR family regulator
MACILIIENEVLFRQVVAAALTQDGHSVFEAGDGRTAASVLKALRVDLILTDLVMPNGDGIEVIKNLRLDRNPIPVIAMTGWHSQSDVYSGIATKLGAQCVLRKPFTMSALLGAVSEVSSHTLVETSS